MSEIEAVADVWQLSPTLSLVRVGDEWLMDDPARGGQRMLNTFPEWLGRALTGLASTGTVTPEFAADLLRGAGVPAEHLDFCLRSLVEGGVLVDPGFCPPERDAGSLRDRQWAMISPPADYRDSGTRDADMKLMYSYAAEAEPPASSTPAPAAWARILLPRRGPDAEAGFLGELGRLLYLTHGVQSEMDFGPLPRSRRTTPSFGASHPFDISVSTSRLSGKRTTYYYQASEHSLVALPTLVCDPDTGDAPEPSAGGDFDLSIHLAIERAHWRYRTSQVYPTVLLDLGHLTETLHQVCESMGVGLTVTAGRMEPALSKDDQALGPRLRKYRVQLRTRG